MKQKKKLPRPKSVKNSQKKKYFPPYVNGSLKGTDDKYPNIISTYSESRGNFNPNSTYIPKIEEENLYKYNISLKEDMNRLKEDYSFLKANNHKLTLLLGKKEKEIDELTTEIINLRNEVERLNSKIEKNNNKNTRLKTGKNKNKKFEEKDEKEEKKSEEKFETAEQRIEKSSAYSKMKVQYNNLNKLLKEKDDEIFKLKKNLVLTKANEEKIQSEILLKELNKIKSLYENVSFINNSKGDIDTQNRILKSEIETQHGVIVQLNTNLNNLKNDKKNLEKELDFLREKVKSNQNSSKMLSNENKKLQNQMQIILKNEVLKEDWVKEKKELNKKIESIQKDLDYYRLLAVQLKDYNPNNKKNQQQQQDNKSVLNESNISLFRVVSKNNKMDNQEEKEDTQILLFQSIIKELTDNKRELEEKIKFLENQLYTNSKLDYNQNSTFKKDINQSKSLKDNNIKDNNLIDSNMKQSDMKNTLSDINQFTNLNDKLLNSSSKLPQMEDMLKSNISQKLEKFKIEFEDILLMNFESKNVTKENAKTLFSIIFSQFSDIDLDNDDDIKEQIISSLSNSIAINLNCNTIDKEKKEIENYLSDLYDEDDNSEFKNNFYEKFNNIPDHSNKETNIKDEEYTQILQYKLFPNKTIIDNLIKSFPNTINLNTLNDIFYKNNIYLTKNEFMYLCYKLKNDNCNSLYEVDIKEITFFVQEPKIDNNKINNNQTNSNNFEIEDNSQSNLIKTINNNEMTISKNLSKEIISSKKSDLNESKDEIEKVIENQNNEKDVSEYMEPEEKEEKLIE